MSEANANFQVICVNDSNQGLYPLEMGSPICQTRIGKVVKGEIYTVVGVQNPTGLATPVIRMGPDGARRRYNVTGTGYFLQEVPPAIIMDDGFEISHGSRRFRLYVKHTLAIAESIMKSLPIVHEERIEVPAETITCK